MSSQRTQGSPSKIRVLHIITRLNVGGPAKYVAWLLKGLDPERFEQRLLHGIPENHEDDMKDMLDLPPGAAIELAGLRRSISPWRDLRCLLSLLKEMIAFRPHLVATHTSKAGLLGRMAFWLYRLLSPFLAAPWPRSVHTFHGHVFSGYFGPAKEKAFLTLERILGRVATGRIIAISPRQRAELREVYRVAPDPKFRLLPLGVDLEALQGDGRGREEFRAELGVGLGAVLIGAVGRVASIKNYPLLIKAAGLLRQERPQLFQRCRFVIIGGGEPDDLQSLQDDIQREELGGRFQVLGSRDDPARFFNGLDLLCLCSINEGTPLAIIEGGACGLPVLATEVGGVPDLLGPQTSGLPGGVAMRQRGLTVPSQEARALAAGLIWLLEHPHEAANLGNELRGHMWSDYSLERHCQRLGAIYLELCGKKAD